VPLKQRFVENIVGELPQVEIGIHVAIPEIVVVVVVAVVVVIVLVVPAVAVVVVDVT
jgi:hypothetical protein